jgi:methylated-DNA-[protein]-cysteine S-methyltransferase
MTNQAEHTIFATIMGWVGILGSSQGIQRTTLPQPSAQDACRLLGEAANCAGPSPKLFTSLIDRFQAYFDGAKVDFPDKLDLSGATPFQRQVWQITRLIPHGDTRSYKWVAEQIEEPGTSRAVGQALGKNPLPIIVPCHRVIASDGGLGGFSGGLEMKRRLLHLEAQGNSNFDTPLPQLNSLGFSEESHSSPHYLVRPICSPEALPYNSSQAFDL